MISISTIELKEGANNITINETPGSLLNQNTARVTLIPTLDGGAVPIHGGVSTVDRPVSIKADISKTQESTLWELFENNIFLLMAHVNTLNTISIKKLKTDQGKLDMSIIIINKEN